MKNWTKIFENWVSVFASWWNDSPEIQVGLVGGYNQPISFFRRGGRYYLQTNGSNVSFNAPAFLATYHVARIDITGSLKTMLAGLQESQKDAASAFGFMADDGQIKLTGSFRQRGYRSETLTAMALTIAANGDQINILSTLTAEEVTLLEKYLETESKRRTVSI